MSGITAHVVSGPPGSGKSALIRRLVAQRRSWLGLINATDGREAPMLRRAPSGCPCCTGRVVMQVELVRALRETRPERVLLEVPSSGHVAEVMHALGSEPLGRYLLPGRAILLPVDATLVADALELS